ncbi:hypothetical protein RMP42_04255 [Roseomonas mucosa]|nr:hypothetical protein RMP42_04255 [Roseomonas mucosa]
MSGRAPRTDGKKGGPAWSAEAGMTRSRPDRPACPGLAAHRRLTEFVPAR